jgi:TonB family protein
VRIRNRPRIDHLEAADLFQGLVVSDPPRLRPPSRIGVGSSVVGHAFGIAALVVLPILASEELPRTHGSAELPMVVASIQVLPPAPVTRSRALAPVAPRPPAAPAFEKIEMTVPVVEPDQVRPEPPPLPLDIEAPTAEDLANDEIADIHDQLIRDPDVPPRLIRKTNPQFPEQAARAVREGRQKVTVEILVGADGRVVKARVVDSVPLLDDAALKCVKEWAFEPAQKRGRKVPTIVPVVVSFEVESH